MEERTASMKINLTPEAIAALNADADVPLKAPPRPMPTQIVQLIRRQVAEVIFGPSLKPTFRQQLLRFSASRAIKACWAADNFQRMARARAQ